MEFNPIPSGQHDSTALAQPDFGMLRAWIAARQQALPTVRLLVDSQGGVPEPSTNTLAANLALLAGHVGAAGVAGSFSHRFANDATCDFQGEDDA